MRTPAAIGLAVALILGAGCEREKRAFDAPPVPSNPRAEAGGLADLQPGQPGRGMQPTASAGGYNEHSAYEVAQGKQWFRWYNCAGCHAQGGGAIGPALMDNQWIYGSSPDAIFATIVEGRPNGMPSFAGKIPSPQVWELVSYVRSLSALNTTGARSARSDHMMMYPGSQSLQDPEKPKSNTKPPAREMP